LTFNQWTNTSPRNNYAYNGNEEQVELEGVSDFNARFLDRSTGRFWQVDPLADAAVQLDQSPYQFGWNNPTNLNDPTGECPINPGQCLAIWQGIQAVGTSLLNNLTPVGTFRDGVSNMVEGTQKVVNNEVRHGLHTAEVYEEAIENGTVDQVEQNYELNKLEGTAQAVAGLTQVMQAGAEGQAMALTGATEAGVNAVASTATKPVNFVDNLVSNPESVSGMSADDIVKGINDAGFETTTRTMRSGRGQMIHVNGHSQVNAIKVHSGGGRHTLPRTQILGQNQGTRLSIKVVNGTRSQYTGNIAEEVKAGTQFIFTGGN
jgi:RHS repeat-associated protein